MMEHINTRQTAIHHLQNHHCRYTFITADNRQRLKPAGCRDCSSVAERFEWICGWMDQCNVVPDMKYMKLRWLSLC